jgi:hypothetical protein
MKIRSIALVAALCGMALQSDVFAAGATSSSPTIPVYSTTSGKAYSAQESDSGSGSSADFKGSSEFGDTAFGALAGIGVINDSGGFALIPTLSHKILPRGFVPDVNDAVWVEAELGPVFFSGATALWYSAHLRWDFVKDDQWTFFGLGGLAGDVTPDALGHHFQLFPRFGVGALYSIVPYVKIRAEISHELIAVGVDIPF